MRFAYIDSQGKEVGIPSVDALQLRIELGAITEETMFYDENTDKWGPAKEHEIFRTLSRELRDKDEGGFVAPPPPTMMRTPSAGAPGDDAEPEPVGDAESGAAAEPDAESGAAAEPDAEPAKPAGKPKDPDPFALEEGPSEPAAEVEDVDEVGAAPTGEEEAEVEASGEPEEEEESLAFGEVDLDAGAAEASEVDEFGTLADPTSFGDLGSFDLVDSDSKTEREEEPPYESEEGAFDFGDFGEMGGGGPEAGAEESPAEDEEDEEEEVPSFEVEGELEMEDSGLEEEEDDEDEGEGEGGGEAAPSDLALEAPLSEYSPDRPPGWMDDDEEEESIGGGTLELEGEEEEEEEPPPRRRAGAAAEGDGGDSGDAGDREAAGRGERPAPRARPARPKKKEKSNAGRIALVAVVVAALGGGGWFAWSSLQNGEPSEREEVVRIPELAASLQPTLDAASGPAYQATMDSLRALGAELPAAPSEEWLAGRYLANPSQFEDVQAYWEGLSGLLETIRERETELFTSAFEARLDSLGVTGADRTALVERASAGFRAARPERAVVYGQLETLIRASLDLHDFLVGNEGAIEYSPSAGGLSRDPVTEVEPATEALGEEMWDRVRDITRALADLGALEDRVGTERLLDIVFGQLREVPVR